jgi:hypothetical protein
MPQGEGEGQKSVKNLLFEWPQFSYKKTTLNCNFKMNANDKLNFFNILRNKFAIPSINQDVTKLNVVRHSDP